MAGSGASRSEAQSGAEGGKVQVTVYLPRSVAEAARDAVVATGHHRRGYRSLSDLVADSVDEKVARLAKQFNNGLPFPARQSELHPGRPLRE